MKRLTRVMLGIFILGTGYSLAGGPGATAQIGQRAPDFTLSDQDGHVVSLKDFADKTVVLEWTNPECPFVVRHLKAETMSSTYRAFKDRDVVWLAINSTHTWNREKNQAWRDAHALPYPVLDDHEGEVGRLYGARTTPHLFIVHRGVLVYDGAIDDDPRGQKESPENFVAVALKAVFADAPVELAKNQSYGCSVKYAAR